MIQIKNMTNIYYTEKHKVWVTYLVGTWSINIGNAFIDIGPMQLLKG